MKRKCNSSSNKKQAYVNKRVKVSFKRWLSVIISIILLISTFGLVLGVVAHRKTNADSSNELQSEIDNLKLELETWKARYNESIANKSELILENSTLVNENERLQSIVDNLEYSNENFVVTYKSTYTRLWLSTIGSSYLEIYSDGYDIYSSSFGPKTWGYLCECLEKLNGATEYYIMSCMTYDVYKAVHKTELDVSTPNNIVVLKENYSFNMPYDIFVEFNSNGIDTASFDSNTNIEVSTQIDVIDLEDGSRQFKIVYTLLNVN